MDTQACYRTCDKTRALPISSDSHPCRPQLPRRQGMARWDRWTAMGLPVRATESFLSPKVNSLPLFRSIKEAAGIGEPCAAQSQSLLVLLLLPLSGFRHRIASKEARLHHPKLEKAGFGSSDTGKGKSKISGRHITHGYHLVKGKSNHEMEDYVVAKFKKLHHHDTELGLFAIFDGHLGHGVADYLQSHLFENILHEPEFWTHPEVAMKEAYRVTDDKILEKAVELGRGGSTAVTAILIDGVKLVVANVGDSRAVICNHGMAKQLSVDHEPSKEREAIESKGGFVTNLPGDVPRVDGQLAVARAFGDRSLKKHLSSEPDVTVEMIDEDTEFIILASDGLWKVMSNEEAVNSIKGIKDAQMAAKHLTDEALSRKSKDDISVIVVSFH